MALSSSQRRFSTSREMPQSPPRAQAALSGEAQPCAGSQAPPLPPPPLQPTPLGLQEMEARNAFGNIPSPPPHRHHKTCLELLLVSAHRTVCSQLCSVMLHPPHLEARLAALTTSAMLWTSRWAAAPPPQTGAREQCSSPCGPGAAQPSYGQVRCPRGLAPHLETSRFGPGDGHSSITVKSYL